VDRRADIWSFGVVLFEMLAGGRLFEGESVAHILADVLRGPIDFDRLPKDTPPSIRELLKRCLDRDIKNRLQAIGEARVAIQGYLANPASGAGSQPAADSQAGYRKPLLGWPQPLFLRPSQRPLASATTAPPGPPSRNRWFG